MGLQYHNLDEETRKYMLEEIEISIAAGKMYESNYLTPTGKSEFPSLLRNSCETGSDDTLAAILAEGNRLLQRTMRKKPTGGFTEVDVPHTANSTLAEGEFNRFYIRAMCRRAQAEGRLTVLVYRAADRDKERSASIALIGQHVDAAELLAKLRELPDFKSGFPEPNTGLSVTHS
jgi:hypothetical protein